MRSAKNPTLVKGYIGPGTLGENNPSGIRFLLDPRVVTGTRWITGANKPGHHVYDLVAGRDFEWDGVIEAAEVRAGDPWHGVLEATLGLVLLTGAAPISERLRPLLPLVPAVGFAVAAVTSGRAPMRVLALGLAVTLITAFGMAAQHYIGKRMIEWAETVMMRIPLFNKIYGSVKQVNDALNGVLWADDRQIFKGVCERIDAGDEEWTDAPRYEIRLTAFSVVETKAPKRARKVAK